MASIKLESMGNEFIAIVHCQGRKKVQKKVPLPWHMISPSGIAVWQFDQRGRVITETKTIDSGLFVARWYDPAVGRFAQGDSVVPEGGQGWDRYAYVNHNPLRYVDASGHDVGCSAASPECADTNGLTSKSKYDILVVLYKYRFGQPQLPVNPGGSGACSGPNPSVLCLPTPQPSLLPQPLQSKPPSGEPPYQGLSDEEFDALLWFWEYLASPFFKSIEMYDIYRITNKGGYKAIRYALPTGFIEATISALRQGYRDSWTQNLSPYQRFSRMSIVFAETLITDVASTYAATNFGSVAGAVIGGSPGAAIGYGGSAALITYAGDRFWTNTVNPWLMPTFGLGIWP